ncbi:tetratricopeptide repeat protein [Pseudoalteromonas sp. S558]|uniref:tetratricopeptide repeat protein n=1 Tax=Pseudoalteromonas sp. S558 TaxID=2066515 RepID=UPI00110B093E|nr:tetratricopeptide repeat protein [Pseudoalteromonas sp. S558]TMO03896.1 hypothetical protein CWB66_09635 [Pseudoalteromonas sp. S558]
MFLNIVFIIFLLFSYPVSASVCEQNKSVDITSDILTCKQKISKLKPHSTASFEAKLELAVLYRQAGDLALANSELEQLLSQSLSISQQYHVTRQLGINAYRQRGYIQSLTYFHKTQKLATQLKNLSYEGQTSNDLANVYQALGDLDTALTLFLNSYDIAKQLNDLKRQAVTLNNLGNISRDINQLDDAIVSFRQAHLLHTQLGNQTKANHTLISLAEVFFKKLQFDKAINLINTTLTQLNNSGAHTQASRAYLLLAEIALAQNKLNEAHKWLATQKRTRSLIQNDKVDQRALLIEAKLKQLEGNDTEAQVLLKQGLAKNHNQNSQLTELFYIALAQSQQQSKQYRDALSTLEDYNTMLRQNRADTANLYQLRLKQADILPNKPQHNYFTLYNILAIFSAFIAGVLLSYKYLAQTSKPLTTVKSAASEETTDTEQDTRQLIVEVMTLSLSIWEQTSSKTRIELAEESKMWKVNIDDGRLRVRTLERYLAIKTLPKKPRWRNIIKTAHYVINHCNEEHEDIHKLKQQIQKLEVLAKASPHYLT